MILSDVQIRQAMKSRDIVIEPFDDSCLGSNSYDVHLGSTLMTYTEEVLDCKKDNEVKSFSIPDYGFVLVPGQLYLGVTQEHTETRNYVPWLDGKSSIGRLGILIHFTAGRGDNGWIGAWTLEIAVIHPVRVYAGMPIGQISYFETTAPSVPYNEKESAKYDGRPGLPQSSRMWMNFRGKR